MKKQRLFLALAFFIFTAFLIGGCGFPSVISDNVSYDNPGLKVSFIDVDQGDSTLIECDGKTMLIDAGIYGERYTVTSYISGQGIERLDYCVATHPHSDHIGGMAQVIYNFDVDTLVYPVCDTDSSSWYSLLDACDEKGVSYLNPEPGDSFSLGSATVTVLSPCKDASYESENDYSLVLKIEYGDISFLLTGDAEKKVEKELLESGFDLSADVLKCGHHGSSTSSCEEFIDAVSPEAAVISCGLDNDYGHPHDETLDTLQSRGIKIYRTDLQSTVIACTDGETVSFYTEEGTDESSASTTAADTASADYTYVGNKNSKVFHCSDCSSVSNMKESNKVFFDTRTDAVNKGYSPCKACNP